MAIADKDILITPNRSGILGNQPNVVFTGADSSIGDSAAITVTARPENSGTLSFTGTAGQLFSITNSLEGTIFAVNDVSGIPSLEIDDAGIIKMAEFNGRILLGGATDDSSSLLQLSGHVRLNDNSEIKFGDDSDFVIFHNGSNSVIRDQGTGSLFLQTSRLIVEDLGSNKSIDATDGGSVDLYHNGSKKFETTSTGATITGTVNADSGTIHNLNIGTMGFGGVTGFRHSSLSGTTNYAFLHSSGGKTYVNASSGQSIDFRISNSNVMVMDTNGLTLQSNDNLNLSDTSKINFGASNDLQIYHNGSNSYIDDGSGTGALIFKSNTYSFRNAADNEQLAVFNENGSVVLYHNNVSRLDTLDSGVNITGNLRVNNAEFTAGASAGFAIAMAIAL